MSPEARRMEAAGMLVLTTVFWSLSFPVMKSLGLVQQELLPGVSSWFTTSLCVVYRFGLAALVMALLFAPRLRGLTRLEVAQGLGLGLFGSAGVLFQMDGLSYTPASTSAFLTQFYCLIIPVWLAVRERRLPSAVVTGCCLAVLAGVGVLSGFNWREFRLGRGEIETLIGSVLFTGQILWLQRPCYARNDVMRFSLVMFVVMALTAVPPALATTPSAGAWLHAYSTAPPLVFLGILVFGCTFGGYLLMNRWQPFVSATQAGLIYCAEPVFVSLLVLFLPAWLARFAGVDYANESLTWRLLLGGGLITLANVIITVAPPAAPPPPAPGAAAPVPDPAQG